MVDGKGPLASVFIHNIFIIFSSYLVLGRARDKYKYLIKRYIINYLYITETSFPKETKDEIKDTNQIPGINYHTPILNIVWLYKSGTTSQPKKVNVIFFLTNLLQKLLALNVKTKIKRNA